MVCITAKKNNDKKTSHIKNKKKCIIMNCIVIFNNLLKF